MGENISSRITEDSMQRLMMEIGDVFRNFLEGKPGKYPPRKMELELKRKDGSTVWTEVNVNTLTDQDKRPVGTVGITRDITQRRRDRKELEMLLSAFKLTSEAILVTDLEGNIQDVNDSFLELFKVNDREKIIGIKGFSLLEMKEKEKARNGMEALIADGSTSNAIYEIKDLNGELLTINTNAALLRDENGDPKGFVIIVKMITED